MTAHPRLPGRLADDRELRDSPAAWPVTDHDEKYASAYLDVHLDTIVAPDGGQHPRVVVSPRGAIGIVVLDEDDHLLLVEQYRHPVGRRLLEIPAGTLDVPGETPAAAAVRELAEEADLVAATWEPLIDTLASPGYSSEAWQVFRATTLTAVPLPDRTERLAEEADMAQWWLPFDAAVDAVLEGRISDSMTVSGILAEQVLRGR